MGLRIFNLAKKKIWKKHLAIFSNYEGKRLWKYLCSLFLLDIYLKDHIAFIVVSKFRLWHTIPFQKEIWFWRKNMFPKWLNDLSGSITQKSLHLKLANIRFLDPRDLNIKIVSAKPPPGRVVLIAIGPLKIKRLWKVHVYFVFYLYWLSSHCDMKN